MDFIVKKASALTTEEKAAQGLTGIPANWPVESYPYSEGEVPEGFEVMSEEDLELLKSNNRAAYDAWLVSIKAASLVQQPDYPTNTEGVRIVEVTLRKGNTGSTNFTIVTPDFSDRTNWYQKSVKITDETLTSGDNTVFTGSKAHWINIRSSKLTIDYKKVLERDGSLSPESKWYVVIKDGGVTVPEANYTIDYTTGTVTFDPAHLPSGTVTATYWHNDGVANCSEFLLTPPPGFKYILNHIECQFSRHAVFQTAISVEIWAGAVTLFDGKPGVNLSGYMGFIPQAYDAGYGQSRSRYRNMNDLINWTNNAYPMIPSCGDLEDDIMCFPFHYVIHPEITSKLGVLIRIRNENDTPLDAEISTVTFYMEKAPA